MLAGFGQSGRVKERPPASTERPNANVWVLSTKSSMAIFAHLFEILPMVHRNGSPSLEVGKNRSELPSK
jgi:hypothetical protein